MDDRPDDNRQSGYQSAGQTSHLHGTLHGNAFGYQLTKDQGEVREDQGDQDHREGIHGRAGKCGDAEIHTDPVDDVLREAVSGKSRAKKASQSNADLDGGEKSGRLLHHTQQLRGQFISLFLQFTELVGTERDYRNFCGGEKGIDKN